MRKATNNNCIIRQKFINLHTLSAILKTYSYIFIIKNTKSITMSNCIKSCRQVQYQYNALLIKQFHGCYLPKKIESYQQFPFFYQMTMHTCYELYFVELNNRFVTGLSVAFPNLSNDK